jgi:hypothetical protein
MFRDRHFDFYKLLFHDGTAQTWMIVRAASPEDARDKLLGDRPDARLMEVQPL